MVLDKQSATEELGLRTAKAASFLISGRVLALIISAAMFVVVARLLAPHNYGIYVLITSVVAFITTLGNPNIGPFLKEHIPRLKAKNKTDEIGVAMGDALLLSVLLGGGLVVLCIALGNQISTYFLNTTLYIYALDIGLIAIVFNLSFNTFSDALISINHSEKAAGAAVVHSVVQALVSIGLILLGYGVIGALLGFSAGLAVSFLLQLYLVHRKYPLKFKFNGMFKRMKETINFAKHLTLSGMISTVLLYFSVIYLGFFEIPSIIGFYGIAQKIGASLDLFGASIALALIPMFSEAFGRRRSGINVERLFYYSVYFSLVFATPAIMLVVIFAQPLILLFFGAAYLGATPYLQLIAVSLLIIVVANFGPNLLIGEGNTRKVLKYAIISGVLELIAMISLTYYFGVVGMIAAVFYLGNFILAALYVNYLWKTGSAEAKIRFRKILQLLLANLVVAGIVALVLSLASPFLGVVSYALTIAVGIVLYLIIYPVVAALLHGVERSDLELLKGASSTMPVLGPVFGYLLGYTTRFLPPE